VDEEVQREQQRRNSGGQLRPELQERREEGGGRLPGERAHRRQRGRVENFWPGEQLRERPECEPLAHGLVGPERLGGTHPPREQGEHGDRDGDAEGDTGAPAVPGSDERGQGRGGEPRDWAAGDVDADGAADVVELLGEERGRYRVVEAGARAEHDGEDDERGSTERRR